MCPPTLPPTVMVTIETTSDLSCLTHFPRLSQEAYIADLDAKSGASLKLTLLNPRGRIWTMVAGGGASVVYRYLRTKPEQTRHTQEWNQGVFQ